jgi:UDP-glucose 4-epimerase
MLTHLAPEPVDPARVVILGARGFLATHLRAWCERQAIDCFPLGSADVNLEDEASFQRLADHLRSDDVVVMTATLTPDKGYGHEPFLRNVRMAETVCRALAQARCAHFVYLSSDAVYDAHKIPLDEDSTREPVDLYALSHTTREMVFGTALGGLSIPFCILRPTSIYGPGDTHNAYGPNRFVRSALRDARIELFGDGEERRSHVYVDDVMEILGRVLRHRSVGTLNVAYRPATSFAQVARLVSTLVGGAVRVVQSPRKVAVVHRPYKPTQVFRFLYNLGRPIGPVVHRTFVNSAVFASFPGFAFTPLERGLDRFVAAERTAPARSTSDAERPMTGMEGN